MAQTAPPTIALLGPHISSFVGNMTMNSSFFGLKPQDRSPFHSASCISNHIPPEHCRILKQFETFIAFDSFNDWVKQAERQVQLARSEVQTGPTLECAFYVRMPQWCRPLLLFMWLKIRTPETIYGGGTSSTIPWAHSSIFSGSVFLGLHGPVHKLQHRYTYGVSLTDAIWGVSLQIS